MKNCFRVDEYLDNGDNAWVFTATNISQKDEEARIPIVIKIQKYDQAFEKEIEALIQV